MLFPPSWYSGPPDAPEPPEDDLPEDEEVCKHGNGPGCTECPPSTWTT